MRKIMFILNNTQAMTIKYIMTHCFVHQDAPWCSAFPTPVATLGLQMLKHNYVTHHALEWKCFITLLKKYYKNVTKM